MSRIFNYNHPNVNNIQAAVFYHQHTLGKLEALLSSHFEFEDALKEQCSRATERQPPSYDDLEGEQADLQTQAWEDYEATMEHLFHTRPMAHRQGMIYSALSLIHGELRMKSELIERQIDQDRPADRISSMHLNQLFSFLQASGRLQIDPSRFVIQQILALDRIQRQFYQADVTPRGGDQTDFWIDHLFRNANFFEILEGSNGMRVIIQPMLPTFAISMVKEALGEVHEAFVARLCEGSIPAHPPS